MKLSRATIALYVGLVFASGAVLGFFGNRLYSATSVSADRTGPGKTPPLSPEEFRKRLIDEYTSRLSLTSDQVQQMSIILDESQAQVKAIRDRMDPEFDAVRANQVTRMKHILSSAQQPEYEKMLKERQQNQQQQRRNGRPGGPGF
jgi:hypothetical protein